MQITSKDGLIHELQFHSCTGGGVEAWIFPTEGHCGPIEHVPPAEAHEGAKNEQEVWQMMSLLGYELLVAALN